MSVLNRKSELLNAFILESKASECYDKVWCSFTDAEKENMQATLIAIFFSGDKQYKQINDQYRKDATKLTKENLKYIQSFHRSAMAFSRRKAKESDHVEDMVTSLVQSGTANVVSPAVLSSTDTNKDSKRTRVQGDKKETTPRETKPKDPEDLIAQAIVLIKRPDVKELLMQALRQMKMGCEVTTFTQPAADYMMDSVEDFDLEAPYTHEDVEAIEDEDLIDEEDGEEVENEEESGVWW